MAASKNSGNKILLDPRTNKSTAFTEKEKKNLGLIGLLPDVTESEDMQLKRVEEQLNHKKSDLERYIYLGNLLDINETLYYRVIMSDPARFLPIIYDPTIGEACLKYNHIIRRPRGLYISIKRRGKVNEVLKNWQEKDIRFICVTNGGRILGLGDLGANGMPIPIGKLQLYTAAAGVPPKHLLPVYLDTGTNNEYLRKDPLYLGLKAPRPKTEELNRFVDEFVDAVQKLYPKCCIHFEDWTGVDAVHLLARYRDKVCCYNDDIQGTAGITLAGLINANKILKQKLKDQRILFLGAGSAGIGIADLIVSAMKREGLSEKEARKRISLFDVNGLLQAKRTDLYDFQRPYAHDYPAITDFVHAINLTKPTAIIGVSTVGGAFTEDVVKAVSKINKRPIIFSLSNPTFHAECTAEQAFLWSKGSAIFAAGVQFGPVDYKGKTYISSQANNFYIFPAIGLAVFATQAKRVPDALFIEAAKAVADQLPTSKLKEGILYPLQSNILESEVATAKRVAKLIFELGLARVAKPKNLDTFIHSHLYTPIYPT